MDSDSDSSEDVLLGSEEFKRRVEEWQPAAALRRTAARAPVAPESSSSDSEHDMPWQSDSEHISLGSDDDAIDAGAEDDEEVPGLDSQLVQALEAAAEARRQGGEAFLERLEEIAQDASDDSSVVDLAHLGGPQQEEEEEEELEDGDELQPDRAVVDAQHNLYENAANAAPAPTVPFLDMDFGSGDDEDDDDHLGGFFRTEERPAPNPEPRSRSNGQRLRDLTVGQSSVTTNRESFASLLAPGSAQHGAAPGSPQSLLHPDDGSLQLHEGFTALWRLLEADDARDAGLAFGRLLASRALIKGQRDVEKQIRSILADVGQADNWQNQELLAALRRRIFRLFSFSGQQLVRFSRGLLLMIANPGKHGKVINPVLVDVVGAVLGDVLKLVTFEDDCVVPGERLEAVQKTCPRFGLQHALLSFIYGYLLNKCRGGVGEVEKTSEDAYGPPYCVKRVGPPVELDEDVACQECYYGNKAKFSLFFCAYTGEGCDDNLRNFIDYLTRVQLVVSVRTSEAIFKLMVRDAAEAADEAADTMVLRGDSDGDADLLDADLLDADAASHVALDDDEDQAALPTAWGADDDDEEKGDVYSYESLERESQSLVEYQHEAKQCLAWAGGCLRTLEAYCRLKTLPPGMRCFFMFRSSQMLGTPTGLIEVSDWDFSISKRRYAYQCLDNLRETQLWKLLGVAEYLSDKCLGLVPANGELFASEPEAHELDSCLLDYREILGAGTGPPRSLLRGMPFAAILADRFGRLCLCSVRDAALWAFPDTVELGMDVQRLGPIRSIDDIQWARPLVDVAEVRATLGVQEVVRHADCHCLPGAVRVAEWLENSTDDDVVLEWACSLEHVNEVHGGVLRARTTAEDYKRLNCLSCYRLHRDHRPDDRGNCSLHRIFVRPKAKSGGADGAGDSSQSMDVGD